MFGFFTQFFGTASNDSQMNSVVSIAMEGLDIQTAIVAHENWKIRLQSYLAGTSREEFLPEVICFDDHCDLGRWIHGSGKLHLAHFPGFLVLIEHHKMFHYAASNVVALSKAGKSPEAEKMLNGVFTTFSKAVVDDLEGLHNAVEHLNKSHKRG